MIIQNFKEQFLGLGYYLARKAKNVVKNIKKSTNQQIQKINEDFARELIEELKTMSSKFVTEYEYRLNEQISENIKEINIKIIEAKNKLFDNLLNEFMNHIKEDIDNNYDRYLEFIAGSITKRAEIFKGEAFEIYLNERDIERRERLQELLKIENYTIIETPIETISGYVLKNKSETIKVDDRIENIIEIHINRLKQEFGQIFPPYVDKRKSATEIMKQRNIEHIYELPEDLKEFIRKNNIHLDNSGNI
ncbi:MAG: V-type ATP synthase subunit E family protein [Promethearchaeota archaeon]